jgi:hypothetical protein
MRQGQHNGSFNRGTAGSKDPNNLKYTRRSDGGFQHGWLEALANVFGEGDANGDKNSTVGASNGVQQAAKTPTTSNFPVHPTEDCNVSGRRLSQICFAMEKEKAQLPSKQKTK